MLKRRLSRVGSSSLLATDAVNPILYVVPKNSGAAAGREAVSKLFGFVTLASLDEKAIMRGMALGFTDIESSSPGTPRISRAHQCPRSATGIPRFLGRQRASVQLVAGCLAGVPGAVRVSHCHQFSEAPLLDDAVLHNGSIR